MFNFNLSVKIYRSIAYICFYKNKSLLAITLAKNGAKDSYCMKTKQEIVNILCESNAFVLPSRSENFSVAVLEALSAGLPVVATLCGGIKECIDEKNGLLVPVEDTNALADAIVNICKNIDNYDRKAIAENCKQRFAPSVIAKQLTGIFEKVVAEHNSMSK